LPSCRSMVRRDAPLSSDRGIRSDMFVVFTEKET
jgi:hypothetical protein